MSSISRSVSTRDCDSFVPRSLPTYQGVRGRCAAAASAAEVGGAGAAAGAAAAWGAAGSAPPPRYLLGRPSVGRRSDGAQRRPRAQQRAGAHRACSSAGSALMRAPSGVRRGGKAIRARPPSGGPWCGGGGAGAAGAGCAAGSGSAAAAGFSAAAGLAGALASVRPAAQAPQSPPPLHAQGCDAHPTAETAHPRPCAGRRRAAPQSPRRPASPAGRTGAVMLPW